jgi:hypothetical protein
MLGNLGVHILDCPNGRFAFVGTLPACLGDVVPASTADVMGGRAFEAPNGAIVTMKFPVFDTRAEAVAHAAARGVTVK